MHMFHNWNRPQSLIFYIPKLENEEEARLYPFSHRPSRNHAPAAAPFLSKRIGGTVYRFENPRAIFQIQEMADALYPYFVGGKLGLARLSRLHRATVQK